MNDAAHEAALLFVFIESRRCQFPMLFYPTDFCRMISPLFVAA